MTRAVDLLVATVALVVLSPLLIVTALAVRLTSRGPVLYRQLRVGQHGKLFSIYKFRTMVADADRLGASVTTRDDPRITAPGRFLRRTKIDELPQLFNVVRGEMALVGPRPDVPEIVNGYSAEMLRVLEVRPGLTSLASLDLADEEALLAMAPDPHAFYVETVVPAKVAVAMRHVDDRSLALEAIVIARTAWKLVRRLFGTVPEGRLTRSLRAELATVTLGAHEGTAAPGPALEEAR